MPTTLTGPVSRDVETTPFSFFRLRPPPFVLNTCPSRSAVIFQAALGLEATPPACGANEISPRAERWVRALQSTCSVLTQVRGLASKTATTAMIGLICYSFISHA
jgi:hypothetical protein